MSEGVSEVSEGWRNRRCRKVCRRYRRVGDIGDVVGTVEDSSLPANTLNLRPNRDLFMLKAFSIMCLQQVGFVEMDIP